MHVSSKNEDDQTALWNGAAGLSWVELQDTLDRMFEPFEALLVEVVESQPRACVLDVGCGTGSTTLALARRLGSAGRCVGIDISEPMLERARMRAERDASSVSFI